MFVAFRGPHRAGVRHRARATSMVESGTLFGFDRPSPCAAGPHLTGTTVRVIITGGSGLIGRRATGLLAAEGHEVIVLSRTPEKLVARGLPPGVRAVAWDANSGNGWFELVDSQTVIVNLAGENIAHWRWTKKHKEKVVDSRLAAARAIVDAVRRCGRTPRVVLQASAVGYYGGRGDEELTESSLPGQGFLAELCKQWEKAIPEAIAGRLAFLRLGVVLSREGGAFPPMLWASRFGVSRMGSGGQWFPWVHEDDVASAIRFLMLNETPAGPFNIVAPPPVSVREFFHTLARVRGRPAVVPVPALALKLGMGEMAAAMLDSQRVVPRRLVEAGFQFRHESLDIALRDLVS